jgi:hypothetical protein
MKVVMRNMILKRDLLFRTLILYYYVGSSEKYDIKAGFIIPDSNIILS